MRIGANSMGTIEVPDQFEKVVRPEAIIRSEVVHIPQCKS